MAVNDLETLSKRVLAFTKERDWDQFHNPKDLAIALSVEAAELLEVFLWKKPEEAKIDKIKEELADVLNYALLLADKCNLNIYDIVIEKLDVNEKKYPVNKSRGSAKKYSEL